MDVFIIPIKMKILECWLWLYNCGRSGISASISQCKYNNNKNPHSSGFQLLKSDVLGQDKFMLSTQIFLSKMNFFMAHFLSTSLFLAEEHF